ncbi:unnamed protein product [Cyclocybe aegerita]|uniref:Uncharacterized protein n=1 Tax=Cyclocybe aegerita TaxID=1973307 RepID=A0A8S0WJV5_CYCAE|nr:unnamed protein product [Cyclocybe aegerita]
MILKTLVLDMEFCDDNTIITSSLLYIAPYGASAFPPSFRSPAPSLLLNVPAHQQTAICQTREHGTVRGLGVAQTPVDQRSLKLQPPPPTFPSHAPRFLPTTRKVPPTLFFLYIIPPPLPLSLPSFFRFLTTQGRLYDLDERARLTTQTERDGHTGP